MASESFPALVPYGWSDRWEALYAEVASDRSTPGRVLRHDGIAVMVARPHGIEQVALGNLGQPVTVGDWIVAELDTVVRLLPRSSLLRRSTGDGDNEQLLAANVDLVVIVAGLDRPVKSGRLQRFVTLAWDAGATPLVVLSKSDLVDDADVVVADIVAQVPGVDVTTVAARDGEGIEPLHRLVADRTVVLLGESGAGKSTLVNALVGTDIATTGAVRTGDAKGRHTTTSRNLHVLPAGGVLIDTPGIRSVGIWTDADTVASSFADIEELAEGCRFRDCAHGSEPGCAVREAVDSGSLAPRRLDAWSAMRREADAAMVRADEQARRKADKALGRMAREAQRHKGRNR